MITTIHSIEQQTDNRFVNMFTIHGTARDGRDIHYNVAARSRSVDDLKLKTRINRPDGVTIYAIFRNEKDHSDPMNGRVVLIRQYRFPIDDYIYEMPAGLCEEGEDIRTAAIREMKEETGLNFSPLTVKAMFEAPRFTSVGMSDESVSFVYGYASGTLSDRYLEGTEDITPLLADRNDVRTILSKEKVAAQCSYHLLHYLTDEDPFSFLRYQDVF